MTAVLALIFESPIAFPWRFDAILAVVWLGLLGSGLAYLVFFRLLGRWGATRTSLVAYLLPVYGIALGALVLSEPIDARLRARNAAGDCGDRAGQPARALAAGPGAAPVWFGGVAAPLRDRGPVGSCMPAWFTLVVAKGQLLLRRECQPRWRRNRPNRAAIGVSHAHDPCRVLKRLSNVLGFTGERKRSADRT